MVSKSIERLLDGLTGGTPHFPPTTLYNEGWLLNVVVDWFAQNETDGHALSFFADASWFSEALLPSAFLPRYRGDPLSESRTHADGVIGHFEIGRHGKADFDLRPDAQQFMVLEAKMSSPLSKGTTNAPDFDQAARNVACMAEVLYRANRSPEQLAKLGFCVLAPQSQIDNGKFAGILTHSSIGGKVSERVGKYDGEKTKWYENWFKPLIDNVEIQAISWESIIEFVRNNDPNSAANLDEFYQYCIKFN